MAVFGADAVDPISLGDIEGADLVVVCEPDHPSVARFQTALEESGRWRRVDEVHGQRRARSPRTATHRGFVVWTRSTEQSGYTR
jgi:hypothetical protein